MAAILFLPLKKLPTRAAQIQFLLSLVTVLGIFSSTVRAEIPVMIEDDFSHDLGGFLSGTLTTVGGAEWSSTTNMLISFNEKAQHTDVANSGYVPFQPPTTSAFSIEAVASDRDHCLPDGGGCNYNIGLGFSDDSPGVHPGANIYGLSSLTLAINHGGNIGLWDNRFAQNLRSGKSLEDVGLTKDFQGDIPMLLELDPVNETARAVVNGTEVYNIDYTISKQINWGGFGWSSTQSGRWDDFKIRAQGPADPNVFEWDVDFSGAWNSTSGGSWQLGTAPDSEEHTVIFGDKNTATRMILTDEEVTARSIQFDSANTYVLSGAGTVNLDSIDGLGQLSVTAGDHQIQAEVKLHDEAMATVDAGSTLTFDNEVELNGFTLTTLGAGTVVFNNQVSGPGSVNCSGSCIGNSSIQGNLANGGILTASGLSVAGDYSQAADASLVMELGGSAQGLTVHGSSDLAGTLEVTLADGLQPALGDEFSLLRLGAMRGEFDELRLPALADGLAWNTSGLHAGGSLSVIPEPTTSALLVLGALLVWCGIRSHARRIVPLVAMFWVSVAALTNSVSAQSNIVFADDFNRPNQLLNESFTPVGGVKWDATYTVVGNQIRGLTQDHAFVPYTPPTDTTFSVEATAYRDLNSPTTSQVMGVSFSDIAFGAPPPGLGAASSLSLTINPAGQIEMWDNAINIPQVASGKTLAHVNLPAGEQGPIDMFLQLDPVNNRAVAEVNGIQVYDVSYTIPEEITWVGMFNGGMETATFDEFVVREGALPANPTEFEWRHDHSGFWQTQSHWEPRGAPDSSGANVLFGSNNLSPRTVSVGTDDVTVKSIRFDSAQSYAVSGLGRVTLESASAAENAAIIVSRGTHEFQGPVRLNDDADVTVASGATLEFDHRLNLNGQTLAVGGTGTMMVNSDRVTGSTAGTVQVDGTGVVAGGGTVVGDVINGGAVSPGDSAGILAVDGNYTQSGGGTLVIEIGGTTLGQEYDRLVVNGRANLAGTLDVSLINSFALEGSLEFDILDFDSVSGDFATLNLPSGMAWDASDGTLSFGGSVGQPGDFNGNGIVDAADYTVWQDSGGDLVEYQTWKDHFGESIGTGSGANLVPEPGTLILAFLALCAAVPRRWRGGC